MKGLEGILEQIQQDSQNQAEEILAAARRDAKATVQAAQQEGQRQAAEIMEAAQKEAEAFRQRAESAALLEKRDRILRKKQQLIQACLRQACNDLEQAPPEEYFAMWLQLASQVAQPGEGVLQCNARDLERMPPDFPQRLESLPGHIRVDPTPGNMESGFLLSYGDIDSNCSFPALFQERLEELRDATGAILFAPDDPS